MERLRIALPIAILLALCLPARAGAAGVITALTASANTNTASPPAGTRWK